MHPKVVLMASLIVAAALGSDSLAAQTVAVPPQAGGREWGRPEAASIIWDYGPSSGSNAGCWSNSRFGQNFAEQVSFGGGATIEGIVIFTCIGPAAGTVEIKVLSDDGAGNPSTVLYSEERIPDLWVSDPSGGFQVGLTLTTPFVASPGVTYWIGLAAGTVPDLGQYSVLTPGDGTMAQFSGSTFTFHTEVGDQMFQLLDTPVPVRLEAFEIDR